ncbi:MAG: hypothetical protein HQM07_00200 [Zetaproteobacteria bacterium]|nr:hypothetical protein [Zetaproteobacteria bacterium]
MIDMTTTLAAQMQNTPRCFLCLAGIHLEKKELDKQIKTQLARIGFDV